MQENPTKPLRNAKFKVLKSHSAWVTELLFAAFALKAIF